MENTANFMPTETNDTFIELNHIKNLYDNLSGFKHDFDNIITTIGGYIDLNDMKGLKNYYSGLLNNCIEYKNLQIINPNTINDSGVYKLIQSKYQKAIENNIKINIEIFFNFQNINMPIFDFTRILGILLDNAIESSKECSNGFINITFRNSNKDRFQYVSIENSFVQKDINLIKIFEKGESSKTSHSGIGLWEVKQIVNKYNNVSLKTLADNNIFTQTLFITNNYTKNI